MKKFILGFITGGVICAAVTGFAVEYAVTANPFPITVNGSTAAIEGYNINDSTYFKLRDVADAVGGFDVGFADNTITITTADAPAATPAPTEKTPDGVTIHEDYDGFKYISLTEFTEQYPEYEIYGDQQGNNVIVHNGKTIVSGIPWHSVMDHVSIDDYYSLILPAIQSE